MEGELAALARSKRGLELLDELLALEVLDETPSRALSLAQGSPPEGELVARGRGREVPDLEEEGAEGGGGAQDALPSRPWPLVGQQVGQNGDLLRLPRVASGLHRRD